MKKNLLWAVPLCVVLILAGLVLAIPPFAASGTHRGNIEALASSLTGRTVHISGPLAVALFPNPRLSAKGVTITGPDEETISARSLTVNISLLALLRGRLLAETLELDGPVIDFPWPLPGGPKAIAPPGWLAALHAHINAGSISLGAARFSDVNADIVTGADGTVNVAGSGVTFGRNVALNLAIGAGELTGAAPVAVDAASGNAGLHFRGALNAQSVLTGQFVLSSPALSGTASLTADGTSVSASAVQFSAGKAVIAGTAGFTFAHPAINAELAVQNLDLDALPLQLPPIPVAVTLTASGVTLGGKTLPGLTGAFEASPSGAAARNAQISLPGGARLTGQGRMDSAGVLSGTVSLASPDLAAMLASFGMMPPSGWTAAALSAEVSGATGDVVLAGLNGTVGASHVTGEVSLSGRHLAGALAFDRLDLLPVLTAFGQLPKGDFTADGQVTAASGSLGQIPFEHLAIDGALDNTLVLRSVFANVYGGMATGSVSLDGAGRVAAARAFVFLPSATPLAALLPAGWRLPAAIVQPRLNAALFAEQKSGWLAGSVTGSLGDFSITAAPNFDVAKQVVEGAVTLRHPDAIAAFKLAGLPAGLGWPGPGSISLRASFIASPEAIGLPDFVLSLGNLAVNGRLVRAGGSLAGDVNAGVLALPPMGADWLMPWNDLANAKVDVDISADRVLYDGNTILLGSAGRISVTPGDLTFHLERAALGGGTASGRFAVTTSQTAAPAISVTFAASGVDATRVALPVTFPIEVRAGTLGVRASLTASGYEPKIWLATLGGGASFSAANGTLGGFDLGALGKALTSRTPSADMRAALAAGATKFVDLAGSASFSHGNAVLGTARFTGPDGAGSATGSVDLFDQDVALRLALQPDVDPPIAIETMLLGSWAAPRQYPKLRAALAWKPAGLEKKAKREVSAP